MLRTRKIMLELCNERKEGHLLTQDELQKLQSHLFNMYKVLEEICDRHNLQICLAYGNVIGAMRHKGWIPWDDDLDVHMPRKDYELLITKYAEELPAQYRLYAANSPSGPIARFAKLVDTSTVYVSLFGEKKDSSGVFIDIFPVDNIGRNKIINKIKQAWIYFMMFSANSVSQVENPSPLFKEVMYTAKKGKINYQIRQIWGTLLSFIPSKQWNRYIERFWQINKETGYVHVKSALSMCGSKVPSDIFFPCEKIHLNIGDVYVPHKAEKYLDLIYGDWHKVPDDKDKWHHYLKEIYIP